MRKPEGGRDGGGGEAEERWGEEEWKLLLIEQRNYIYQHSRFRDNSARKCVLSISAGKMIGPDSCQEDSSKVV